MAKSLYSALFDWIVLRINHALLNKKDMEESVPVSVCQKRTAQICAAAATVTESQQWLIFIHHNVISVQ